MAVTLRHPCFVMEKINEPKDIVEKCQASSWNNVFESCKHK